ncbi:SpoIIE family protein phosphatase [Streptacidiphilus sp. PB12-B1b]|uniref:ATP-binding SpoIIE family protein phosphatase n=1 Tax=Streptacidiphilus sp. PB12-B1b TaxID=2705012 RepID=UPI00351A032B
MDIASQALSSVRDNPYSFLQRALPTLLLLVSAVGLVIANPTGHYSLVLAVIPLLAAAVHGVHGTAVVGTLTVTTYLALRHELAETGTTVWLLKLAFIVVVACVGLLLAQARVRERLLAHSRHLALSLQHGLLPQELPQTSAVEVCYRYVPADTKAGVGGDWFDVIQLSGARVALVIGDVTGHGIHAAATMGRLRTAVHTLADLDLAPDELLSRMDDLVVRLGDREKDREPGATCLYLVYDPVSRVCSMAAAGHTPPAFVRPDGSVEFPQLPEHPPLGVGGMPFESTELTLPEGTVIALYTDGLLDLRRRHADDALGRLAEALTPGGHPLDEICDRICADARHRADDDVALLLARTRAVADTEIAAWQYPADPRSVGEARAAVGRQLSAWGLDEQVFPTELAVSELVTNAIRYASAPIALRLIRDRALICEVSDGSSTSPHLHHAQLMDEGGRGLYLVSRIADRWGTRYSGAGKTIWLEQALPAARAARAPAAPEAVPSAAA